MSWPVGQAEINALIAAKEIERVQPDRDGAQAFLDAAARHLTSALALAEPDPEGGYSMAYDAARKSLVALLLTQGLRPTTRGGHIAIEQAINAQFTKPPPRDAFRPFRRIRQTRHQGEYEHLAAIDPDLVQADQKLVVRIHEVASLLMPQLPVFTG